MPSPSGRVILAAAGSGKTTWIARCVGKAADERAAITTFTILNSQHIGEKLWKEVGRIPPSVRVRTWFSFLLEDFVRPYQNLFVRPHQKLVGRSERVAGVNLFAGRSGKGRRKSDWTYWFDSLGRIYNDKIGEFALICDDNSGGAVMGRVARLYQHVYVDEVQDLAGYDLDLLERMMTAGVRVTMVGDPRQGTFSTNQSAKNRKYRGKGIAAKFAEWEGRNLCQIEEQNHSHRCGADICRFADQLYPAYEPIESRNTDRTHHDGVFVVSRANVTSYIDRYAPKVLRYNKRSDSLGQEALNFGASKGLQFDRVLIVPTGPIRKWLKSGNRDDVAKSISKLYVAATRAKQSVAFLFNGKPGLEGIVRVWAP